MSDDDGDDLYVDESASAPPARSTPDDPDFDGYVGQHGCEDDW